MAITVERLQAEIDADPAKAVAGLETFSAAVDMAAKDKTANLDVDTGKADTELVAFEGVLDAATRDRTIHVGVDKTPLSQLSGAIGVLEQVVGHTESGIDAMAKGLGNVTQAGEGATSMLGGGGGGGGLSGALASAAGGAGELFSAIGPIASAIGGLAMPVVIGALITVLPGAFAAAAAGVAVLTGALVPLLGLLGAIPVAVAAVAGGFGVLAAVLGPVIAGVVAYGRAQKDAAQAANDYAQRQHAVLMAQQGLAASTHQVMQAEQALADARKQLKAAPAEAEEALRQAHFNAAQAALNEQSAVLALVDAQKNLKDAQNATSDAMVSTTKQTDYFTGKVYEVAIASKSAVNNAESERKARLAVRQAELNLAEARDANAQAQQHLSEMEAKGIKNSDIMVAARRQEVQAEYALKQARQQQANAAYSLRQAEKALHDQATANSAATSAWANAQKHLSAEGISFVKFIHDDFLPAFWSVSKAGQRGLLPGLEGGLKDALTLVPMLRQEFFDLGRIMGTRFREFMDFWTKPAQKQTLTRLFGDVNQVIDEGLKILRPFSSILANIIDDATPMVLSVLRGIDRALSGFAAFLNSKKGRKETTDFFNSAARFAGLWAEALKPIPGIFLGIAKAVEPISIRFLNWLGDSLQHISDAVNSKSGQDSILSYISSQLPALQELGGVVGDLVNILFNSSKGGKNSSFYNFLHEIRTKLLPEIDHIFKGFDKSTTGGDLVTSLTGFLKVVERIDWKTLGKNVHDIANSINDIATFMSWLSGKGGHKSMAGTFLDLLGPSGSALSILRDIRDVVHGKIPQAFQDAFEAGKHFGEDLRKRLDSIPQWFQKHVTDPLYNLFNQFFNTDLGQIVHSGLQKMSDAIPGPIKKVVGLTGDLADPWHLFHGKWSGGAVDRNQPYLVGEKGPELFIPSTGGRIAPSSPTKAMMESTQPGIDPAMLDDLVRKIGEQMKPDVKVEQTFNERVDPMHVAKELGWELAGI